MPSRLSTCSQFAPLSKMEAFDQLVPSQAKRGSSSSFLKTGTTSNLSVDVRSFMTSVLCQSIGYEDKRRRRRLAGPANSLSGMQETAQQGWT